MLNRQWFDTAAVVLMLALARGSSALAENGVTTPVLRVNVSSSDGAAAYAEPFESKFWDGTRYTWSSMAPVDLIDPESGEVIAQVEKTTLRVRVGTRNWVKMETKLIAGGADTEFVIRPAEAFWDIPAGYVCEAQARVSLMLSDHDENGARASSLSDEESMFEMRYREETGDEVLFAEFLSNIEAGDGSNVSVSTVEPPFGYTRLSTSAMRLWEGVRLRLSAGDHLVITANWTMRLIDTNTTWYLDADADQFGDPETVYTGNAPPTGYVRLTGDCDDQDSARNPGAAELCNGVDDNCDGRIDEGFDRDGDLVVDCLDNCPDAYNPNQEDLDNNGIGDACESVRGDSNADGRVDFADIDCFISAMISDDDWRACSGALFGDYVLINDVNVDGAVDFADIDAFVECVIDGGCE